jgi:hypothetical protein
VIQLLGRQMPEAAPKGTAVALLDRRVFAGILKILQT